MSNDNRNYFKRVSNHISKVICSATIRSNHKPFFLHFGSSLTLKSRVHVEDAFDGAPSCVSSYSQAITTDFLIFKQESYFTARIQFCKINYQSRILDSLWHTVSYESSKTTPKVFSFLFSFVYDFPVCFVTRVHNCIASKHKLCWWCIQGSVNCCVACKFCCRNNTLPRVVFV